MENIPQSQAPVVLVIAGFDPSGGAGIIADIKTISAFGCRSAAAITSITFQNSERVFGAEHQRAESLRSQILSIIKEHEIAIVKIGMLPTAELIREVARLVHEINLPAPVVDPVLRSTSGHQLIAENAMEVLVTELLPLARVVTPNIPEAEQLTGLTITSEVEMRSAARKLREIGTRAALVKGGHLALPAEAVDVLDDEGHVTVFRDEWIDAPNVRGTGCMLSSAIAAMLAQGTTRDKGVRGAREFVADTIRHAQKLRWGFGNT